MFGFGRTQVSDEMQHWILDETEWAVETGLLRADTPLVTPTKEFFPAPPGNPETVTRGLVDNILAILGRPDDKIELLPIERPSAEFRAAGAHQSLSEIAGAWDGDEKCSVIFYDPEATARPLAMLSTLTHEVLHHVLHRMPEFEVDAEEELRTDMHCITTGFGIVQINGAEETGWGGYMRQPTRVFALATMMAVRDIAAETAKSWLSGRMAKEFKRARSALAQHQIRISEIQAALGSTPAAAET